MSNGGNLAVPTQDQYTVTVNSIIQPVKVAGFPGPFQVINLHTSATVWLADNSQVKTGRGMPLNPGSSLTWTGSQSTKELWAILGTDSLSLGQSVDLIISSSVLGWQQNPTAFAIAALNSGSILIDNPTSILSIPVVTGPYTSPTIDVSHYQTLDIVATRSAAVIDSLNFSWQLAGQTYAIDSFAWTAADGTALRKKLACRGSSVIITTTGNGFLRLEVAGSSRPPTPYGIGTLQDRVVASGSVAAQATGTTFLLSPTVRYDGPAIMFLDGSGGGVAAGAFLNMRDMVLNLLAGGGRIQGAVDIGVNRWNQTFPIVIPRNTTRYEVFNGSAGNASLNVEVIAAPEST